MAAYVLKRLAHTVIVLIGITLITFIALHMGGDPTYLYVGELASDETIAAIRHRLGFDLPLHVQYLKFIGNLVQGDFGMSLTYREPAINVVLRQFPATIELTTMAILIALVFAIPLGILAATRRGTPLDGGIMLLAIMGQSIPSFWLGIILILFVGLGLKWFPISGHVAILAPLLQGNFAAAFANVPKALPYLVMPSVTTALFSLSRNARLVRSSMLEVLSQDYIRTAKAKGLAARVVTLRHGLRNAWLPIVTMIGLDFGAMLAGVVVVETVFAWPGVGRLAFEAINQRDIPLVQASVVTFAAVFVLLNLVVDLLYARLDPRIRLG